MFSMPKSTSRMKTQTTEGTDMAIHTGLAMKSKTSRLRPASTPSSVPMTKAMDQAVRSRRRVAPAWA